jgi:hypothetical protein
VVNWGDDYPLGAHPRAGVRSAAEHLAAARLEAFDSHRWVASPLPGRRWICTACWRTIEATHGRPCVENDRNTPYPLFEPSAGPPQRAASFQLGVNETLIA